MNIAIIPARGGSKRIPRKNIRDFGGKPIIAYSIEAALLSESIDTVYVSTDDPEIELIAISFGAKSLGLRPDDLSDDFTSTTEVVRYELRRLLTADVQPTGVAEIYPTAPFLTPQIVDQVYAEMVKMDDASFAFLATKFEYPVQRGFYVRNSRCEPLDEEAFGKRSQDLESVFHDSGQIYWSTAASWIKGGFKFDYKAVPVIVPRSVAIDIDTEDDWLLAEMIHRGRSKKLSF